eukprot:9695814-Alexandrium_andersonii.AAC.1
MAEPVLPPGAGEAEHYNVATPVGEAGAGMAPGVASGTGAEPREEHEPVSYTHLRAHETSAHL